MVAPQFQNSMEKVLGQEYGRAADRVAFLRDNCDAVEDLGYVKQLKTEEIEELKDRLVENNIQLRDVRADKKAANKEFNDQIKQLEDNNDEVTAKLKERSEYVTEPCYKFVDEDTARWATTTTKVCLYILARLVQTSVRETFSRLSVQVQRVSQ